MANQQDLRPSYAQADFLCKLIRHAGVAKLADALDLGSSVERRVGSSPTFRTSVMNQDMVPTEPPADPKKSGGGFAFSSNIFYLAR